MTWEKFRESREKQREELQAALEGAPPWMQEGIEFELSRVWFELKVAGVYLGEDDTED
jgi:hypothetical protein